MCCSFHCICPVAVFHRNQWDTRLCCDRGLFCLWFLESAEAVKPFLDNKFVKTGPSRVKCLSPNGGQWKASPVYISKYSATVSPVQFGFVVVVMMRGPKAESVMPKVHLPMESLSHSSLGFHFPVVRLACLFTQKNTQDSWGSQTAVLLTRNLGCSCDCHKPPAVVCHDNCELKDLGSRMKEAGKK